MACYPAWIRLLQCLRRYHDDSRVTHLYNTAKYSTSFLKYGMAFYYAQKPSVYNFYLLCGGYFCSSVFTLYWDLIHDWEHVEKEILLKYNC
ncbi:Oidioi.mRNA.OKI2018_I69.XSR.g15657.t1.cds [Oikopleura dioica]|uniref:Oidioi.mRNA.OKI2018_I69.XSR.g15657.t1.cds n=1 Tax=Oikopleura dioica TaxID=34765 RepID=A0ABN7SDK6_OIKDI|nr:Oidioi.mRNA.OKI2018_I69.XSR.g15657.t1.cds [Oikopleura dioica]